MRFAAPIVARLFIGNPYYSYLVRTRFPTCSCILSEIVNQICYRMKLDRVLMEPRYIFIEPTNTCNITCIMCPVPDNSMMTRKRKMLTVDELGKVLDANPKLQIVYLTNWGEPMLNKSIIEIISTCSSRGLFTVMTTNATLLTQETSVAILEAGLGVARFSLDGVGEYFERVRKVKGGYAKVKENIEMFLQARSAGAYRTAVELNVTYMRENLDGIKPIDAEWASKVDFINYQGVISVPTIQIGERANHEQRKGDCRQLYRSAFFLTNGEVTTCCADFNAELSMGSTETSRSAFKIMNSDSARALRRAHQSGNLPGICAACTQYRDETIFPRKQSSII